MFSTHNTPQRQSKNRFSECFANEISEVSHRHKYSDPSRHTWLNTSGSSDSLKSFWKRSYELGTRPFSDLSRDAWLGSGLDSGWVTAGLSRSRSLCFLGSVLRVAVLLKCKPSPQPEKQSSLEKVFTQDCSICFCIHLPSLLSFYPLPCFTVGMALMTWCSVVSSTHTLMGMWPIVQSLFH